MTAETWIEKLQLIPHPEGGFYKETYRSSSLMPANTFNDFPSSRNVSTAIYFLIPSDKFSAFHKIKSDELWFHHAGSSLLIHYFDSSNQIQTNKLGNDLENDEFPQAIVPANSWFGSEVEKSNSYSLVSCVVAPGFDFTDFELANREALILKYPNDKELITRLTYASIAPRT